MTDAKRQEIRERIAAGEVRHYAREENSFLDRAGETAIEAKDRFTEFAREHPLTAIAGGLALGVLVSGLFPRSPTRRAGRKAAGIAALGAEAAMGLLHEALETVEHAASDAGRAATGAAASAGVAAGEAGRVGRHRLEDWRDIVADATRRLKRDAVWTAGDVADNARSTKRDAGKRLRRALRRDS